jgi:hypothetical protein
LSAATGKVFKSSNELSRHSMGFCLCIGFYTFESEAVNQDACPPYRNPRANNGSLFADSLKPVSRFTLL